MTMEIERLDVLRFQQIVDEAKRRVNAYCPTWTNHNVSDPGVALIELFAWMTEMTLFQLDQLPEREMKVLLNSVGFEMFPAQAATAPLTFRLQDNSRDELTIRESTKVAAPSDDHGPLIFETQRELVISQPDFQGCAVDGADGIPRQVGAGAGTAEDRLRFEQPGLECFAGIEQAQAEWDEEFNELDPIDRPVFRPRDRFRGDAVYFGFRRSLANALIRVTFDVETKGLGINPLNPPLIWEASTTTTWNRCTPHLDRTGGLNRDGVIEIQLPDVHESSGLPTLGDDDGTPGTDAYWLRLRVDVGECENERRIYKFSPVLHSVHFETVGGRVPAVNAASYREQIGVSDGQPGQRFHLGQSIMHGEMRLRVGDDDWSEERRDEDWVKVDDFAGQSPTSKVYRVDERAGLILFGPQVLRESGAPLRLGAIPVKGDPIHASYRVGGGERGNVNEGTIVGLQESLLVQGVANLEPARGGVDAETLPEALERAPTAVRAGDRAVTAPDFERIVRDAARDVHVVKCLEAVGEDHEVRLLVVPRPSTPPAEQAIDDYALPTQLVDRVRSYLEPRRLVGTRVELTTPSYLGVSVVARVRRTSKSVSRRALRDQVLKQLYAFVNPVVGGPRGQGLGFDAEISEEQVRAVIERVRGVDAVEEVALFEADLRERNRLERPLPRVSAPEHTLMLSFDHRVVVVGEE